MCYSTRQTRSAEQLELHFRVKRLLGSREIEKDLIYFHANGWMHPLMWIIPQEESDRITPSMWGIMPSNKHGADFKEYYKEASRFGAGLNAQSEKLFDHFIYKHSALTKRCIIPVDGFFEPHTAKKKGKDFKIPFYFKRTDGEPINLAGLYTTTQDGYNTFTILTKKATPLFAKIHNKKNRRPVILKDEDTEYWLDNDLDEDDIENVLDDDMPDIEFDVHPISKDLYSRSVDSNVETIIDKIEYEELEIDY